MSIKFRFRHRYLPFLDFEIELRPSITFLGHPMLLRVSLHSPNRRAALLRIFKPRDRTIFPLIEWPWTDHVVDCVADAIDTYRITQDENYDVSDPDAEVAELDRIDAEYEASMDHESNATPNAERAIHTILGAESGWNTGNRLCVARVRAGLSRAQAANQLRWPGITSATLLAIEEGTHDPTPDALGKLANLYDVSVEWLRGESASSPLRAAVADSGLSWADKAKLGDMLDSMAPASEPSAAIPLLHMLWGRAATLGYPRRPKQWWIELQRALELGNDISDVLREAARDLDAHELAGGDAADEPDPDGWRDVSEVTLDEWLAWPWWEWRYSATAGHGRQSSRETPSVPVLGQVRRAPIQGDDTDGWRDVVTVTPQEWAAWQRWEWRYSRKHPASPLVYGWSRACLLDSCNDPSVPTYGQLRRVAVLDWPEMDGQRWTDAADITQAMIDAWPWWEVDRGDFVAVVPGAGVTVSGALAGQWRPLRLPGMSTDPDTLGEIAATDMTHAHFERADGWKCWMTWPANCWTSATFQDWRYDGSEKWIPSVFLAQRPE